ncbi:hypothetical protein ACTU6U_12300 [Microbacterium sp. A196]|uniref:hypothetical protein n=1 Tax=Microbacterium sp. A196 TaxID=3457320 RepID=UPI003FD60A41
MAMSPAPSHGGHHLAPTFGGTVISHAASQRTPRRRRTGVVLAVLGAVVICVACIGTQWGANVAYDDARESFRDAVVQTATSQNELEQDMAALMAMTDAASTIAAADTGTLMDPGAKEVLAAALTDAADAEASTSALLDETLPTAEEKPTWAWELFGEAAELNDEREAASGLRSEFESARTVADDAAETVNDAGTSAILSATDAAGAFEAAHIAARNLDILALRNTAAELAGVEKLDSTVSGTYEQLEAAAAAMLSSEQAEIAEKQGALFEARTQIEAFARGLAPGILLDFDWSAYVNGFGDGDSMGGLATWWYGDPGYATIELSDSVAAHWPGARSQALIAHEVGHAISVKCEGMYDDSNPQSIEAWATAWAISQGFTDIANGTSAYGPPPQELVAVAAGCR